MRKRVIFIEFLYIAAPLAFLILATVGTVLQFIRIATDYNSQLNPYMDISSGIGQNLAQRIVTDLILVSAEDNCPSRYNLLALNQWPGNTVGCYNTKNGTILNGSCLTTVTDPEERVNWKNVEPNQPEPLSIWNGRKFCSYIVTGEFNKEGCQKGYKSCSNGLICVPMSSNCPITAFTFERDAEDQITTLHIERDPNKNPVIQISASRFDMPCLNPLKSPLPLGSSVYPLEDNPPEGCDEFGNADEFNHKVDEMQLVQHYKDNGIVHQLTTLPDYMSSLSGDKVMLYFKTRIDVNTSPGCASIPGLLSVIVLNIKEFSFSTWQMTTLVAYNIILLVFGFVMFFYLYCDKESDQRTRYFKEQKCLFHSFHFLPYIIGILYVVQYSAIPVPNDGGPNASSIIASSDIINENQCFNSNQYSLLFVQLVSTVKEITIYFFGITKLMGMASYSFIVLMLLLRALRGYYLPEVEEYEDQYLQEKYNGARNRPTTELASMNAVGANDIMAPQGYEYEEGDIEGSSPYFPYRDQVQE